MGIKKVCLLSFVFLCFGTGVVKSQYVVLHNFNRISGAYPTGDLTLLGGVLYGMTDSGGVYNKGCIFSMDTNGNNYKDLFNFDSINGAYPHGSLLYASDKFYGMTSSGGRGDNNGCIFSIDTNGNNYKDLLDFDSINGADPLGSLILSGKVLYGMAYVGGTYNFGCVFSIDTNGNEYADILDFYRYNGAWPMGSLIISGKVLYGMTGENAFCGNVFSVDTDGNEYKDLYDFPNVNIGPNGYPYGSLTLSGNKLYGMTSRGDAYPYVGNIFSIDTDGNGYKDILGFDIDDGASPYGSLTLSGGTLYGMTFVGGLNGSGEIFSIDTNGSKDKDLFDFSHSNGGEPWGDVSLSGNMLYGMTSGGGINNAGVIFKFNYITAGVNNLTESDGIIKVYPNPSNGIFNLSLSNVNTACNVEVYNVLGENIYKAKINSDNTEINISGQPQGVYLYRVISETGALVGEGKVILQK